MLKVLKFLIILIFLLLVSCVKVKYIPIAKEPLGLTPSVTLELEDVEFFVRGDGVCLSPDGFKVFLLNERKILSFVIEQNEIIHSYIEYYETENDQP